MARELCEDKSRNTVSSTGFCYSSAAAGNPSFQTHFTNQIQEYNPAEIFSLPTNMEMVGFSKNLHQQTGGSSVQWRGFSTKSNFGSSSSKTINESSSFYDHDYDKQDFTSTSENLMAGVGPETGAWQENRFFLDDSSLRCVLNRQGNERPSHGLSLSLSSDNPSGIGLHSFVELRQTQEADERFVSSMTRNNGFFTKANNIQQQEQIFRDGLVGKVADLHQHGQFHLGNSKYLIATQQLLNEFCSLGLRHGDGEKKGQKTKQWVEENATASLRKQSLQSLDFIELQKRKTRLFSMMEELERRYRHYCDQMKMVASSFEAVAGEGASNVYSALACKALSRHFRCLKDGIVTQIQAVKKAMGEKDQQASVPGGSKGETPRLCILDQTLRRQRAFQQMSLMESHPWRPQRGLPERSVSILRAWLFEHFLHPYPSDVDKHILARQTSLSRSQVSNWFINARVRLWKPMVEDMYLEEVKEQENTLTSSDGGIDVDNRGRARPEDQKPTADQLLRINSDCLSSIINNPPKNDTKPSKTLQNHHQQQQQQQNFSSFGTMELDFSSYNHQSSVAVSYASDSQVNHNFNGGGGGGGGGGGVSLTLGLQQHGGNGSGSLAFSSPPQANSLFYPRDSMEECQPAVHYSLFDGEAPNLPYRNLMEAQMFHDLAG